MNAGEIREAALARCLELSAEVPDTRSVAFRRISARQQQLFAKAATVNPEYFGRDGVLTLTSGAATLGGLLPPAERVYAVAVENPGSSAMPAGRRVTVVRADDPSAGLPPRMTLRDGTLAQVGTDLAGVTSIRVFYSKRPADVGTPTDVPQLPEQFHELLVLDLAQVMTRKMVTVATAAREQFLAALAAEEVEWLADFTAHVVRFAEGKQDRFGGDLGGRKAGAAAP